MNFHHNHFKELMNFPGLKNCNILLSPVSLQKKDFIENELRMELMFCGFPVTIDLPPFIFKHEDATLEELETGNATVIDNLPKEYKKLYWNIVGTNVSLNSSDL